MAYRDSTLNVHPACEAKEVFMSSRILIVHFVADRTNHIARDSESDSRAFIRIEAQVGELALGRVVVELA